MHCPSPSAFRLDIVGVIIDDDDDEYQKEKAGGKYKAERTYLILHSK